MVTKRVDDVGAGPVEWTPIGWSEEGEAAGRPLRQLAVTRLAPRRTRRTVRPLATRRTREFLAPHACQWVSGGT